MIVDTVVFDAGLTLLRAAPTFWDAFVDGIEAAGATPPDRGDVSGHTPLGHVWERHEAAWRAAGEASPHVGDTDAETRYWRGLYLAFLEHLAVDGDHHAIAEHVHRHFTAPGVFRPFPEVGSVLDRLEERDVRLGLLSNWGPALRDILAHEGLLDRFAVVVISGEEGIAKPDPGIFERTLRRLGLPAGRNVAYVGDSLRDDIEPARQLGLTPVLVDRFDRHADHDGLRVTDLGELFTTLPLPQRAAAR